MGLPPTKTKGSGESTAVTTFEIDFPYNTLTRTGARATLGALEIAGGGTGTATTSQNFVFVGPTSGSGAPSFRALVSGDLPTFTQTGTGATAKTILNKIGEFLSVKDFGAVGDGVTDDTAFIQAAITAANVAGGATVYFPPGIYKATSTINMATKVILQGSGKRASVISWNSLGDGLAMTSTINSSNAVSIKVCDLGLTCINGSNTGAGYADVCGTYWLLEGVRITGFSFGVILDQSELADIVDCEIVAQTTASIWLVNGDAHTPTALAGFTNRISVERCQISQAATAYGIIDDGGYCHTFKDNNYNGCLNHIRSIGSHACIISGGEFESAAGACIVLTGGTGQQFYGGTVGQGTVMSISGCQLTPTSGQSAISIVSQGQLVVTGCAFGGTGTPAAVTGLASCAGYFASGNYNSTENGTATKHFSNDIVAASIKGTVTLNSLTASQAVVTDSSKNLASLAYASANTVSSLVQRDASGNFSAGTITAALTGNATNVSGTVAIGNGGTGQITQQAAINALTGTQSSGKYLRSDGTDAILSEILSTDLAIYQRFTSPADAVAAGITFTPTSNKTHVAYYRREGAYMVIDGQITSTGLGAAGSITVDISAITGSPVINTALLPGGTLNTNAGESMLGYAHVWSTTVWTVYFPVYYSTTAFQFVSGGTRLAGNTYLSGSVLNYCVKLPIVGWS